jgi:hypothetical protein
VLIEKGKQERAMKKESQFESLANKVRNEKEREDENENEKQKEKYADQARSGSIAKDRMAEAREGRATIQSVQARFQSHWWRQTSRCRGAGEFPELRQRMGPVLTFMIQAQPYLNVVPMSLSLKALSLKADTHYPTLFNHF